MSDEIAWTIWGIFMLVLFVTFIVTLIGAASDEMPWRAAKITGAALFAWGAPILIRAWLMVIAA